MLLLLFILSFINCSYGLRWRKHRVSYNNLTQCNQPQFLAIFSFGIEISISHRRKAFTFLGGLHYICCRIGIGRQAIDKFGGRWRALKPKEMKDWSAPEVERVFASLLDWREQFTEHQTKVRRDRTKWKG